jgi:hypothetical protein
LHQLGAPGCSSVPERVWHEHGTCGASQMAGRHGAGKRDPGVWGTMFGLMRKGRARNGKSAVTGERGPYFLLLTALLIHSDPPCGYACMTGGSVLVLRTSSPLVAHDGLFAFTF